MPGNHRQCCCGETGCPSDYPCEYCSTTPATIGVFLSSLALCGCTSTNFGTYNSTRLSGTFTESFCLANSEDFPCVWIYTSDAGPITCYGYATDDCSGSPSNTSNAIEIRLIRESGQWRLILSVGWVDLFHGTVSESDCMANATINNDWDVDDCGTNPFIAGQGFFEVMGSGGSAAIEACCEVGI